jgi:uridine monophosphate synthetase
MLNGVHIGTALMLNKRKAIEFGAFRLKLHEKKPNAPLSPFFINIRNKDNQTRPGPLEVSDYDFIARSILQVIKESGIVFDAIAGIPRAGDPIVDAIEKLMDYLPGMDQGDSRIIRLAKEEKDGARRIIPMPGFEYKKGERVLLIDDLVTKADTKLEAIRAVESQGAIVAGLIVLVDRLQGGSDEIKKAGYEIRCAFTIRELLDFYVQEKLIEADKYHEAIEYIETV